MSAIFMEYPDSLRQPSWVLQSASADRPGPEQLIQNPYEVAEQAWSLIRPGWDALQAGDAIKAKKMWKTAIAKQPSNLLLMRVVNKYSPELLKQGLVSRRGSPWGSRIAIVLPGELRCLTNSLSFFKALSRHTDIFICTSEKFAETATQLSVTDLKLVHTEPDHPVGAMQQWHKLRETLHMVRLHETQTGQKYTHILKLRSDFHHVQPKRLLAELVAADGLICSSDKVFGGRRELMMLFEGFYAAIS